MRCTSYKKSLVLCIVYPKNIVNEMTATKNCVILINNYIDCSQIECFIATIKEIRGEGV